MALPEESKEPEQSSLDSLPDYLRIVAEAFIERRGRGTAVSSADLHQVGLWEQQRVPLSVVLDGVDQAFRSKRVPPASLRACAPFVQARAASDGLAVSAAPDEEGSGAGAEDPGASPAASVSWEGGPSGACPLETRVLGLLRAVGEDSGRPKPVRRAAARLGAEVQELLAEEGHLSAETVLALDDAWVALILAESSAAVQRRARDGEARAAVEAAHGALPRLMEEVSG